MDATFQDFTLVPDLFPQENLTMQAMEFEAVVQHPATSGSRARWDPAARPGAHGRGHRRRLSQTSRQTTSQALPAARRLGRHAGRPAHARHAGRRLERVTVILLAPHIGVRWVDAEANPLPSGLVETLETAARLAVSAITCREVAWLTRRGRRDRRLSLTDWLPQALGGIPRDRPPDRPADYRPCGQPPGASPRSPDHRDGH
jgi:hypothetical protein